MQMLSFALFVAVLVEVSSGIALAESKSNNIASEQNQQSILPSTKETEIPGQERTWDDIKRFELAHPNPPTLSYIPFRPTIDPEDYKTAKDAATRRMRELQGHQAPEGER